MSDWKKCSKCGERFPKIAMEYCPYCNGFFCKDCARIHPDLNDDPERNPDYPDDFEEAPDPGYYDEEDEGED